MKLRKIMNNFYVLEQRHQNVYFSYETPIAYQSSMRSVVRNNDWGPTTGKHINWCKNHFGTHTQVSGHEFEAIISIEAE